MATTTEKKVIATKVVTGKVRFSYAHVFEAVAIEEGAEKKYSVALIIPKSDTATIEKLNKAINAAKEEGKSKFGGKIPVKLKLPLRDGDEERPDDEAYKGCFFLNANSATKPGVVDAARNEIVDKEDFYSGCYGRASVTFYAFDKAGNKGIACGLNHVMKTHDGEPLSGRSSAEEDFADLDDLDTDDDLLG